MRTISFIFLFTIRTVFSTHAQVAFPTSNAVWMNTQYEFVWNPPNPIPGLNLTDVDKYCVYGEDTVIQSNVYTQIYHCQFQYKGALREVNSAIYFVPADSTQEYLLYDFGAQIGQTLYNVYVGNHFDEEFELQDFTVQQTGIEIIGGISRRVVYVNAYRWIEGIGCETGLFMEPWPNISNYENRLECFSFNNQMVYPTQGTTCPDIYVDVNNQKKPSTIDVYPVPAISGVIVEFPQPLTGYLMVYNSMRQLVHQIQFDSTQQIELEIEGQSGLYVLEVITDSGDRMIKKVIKQSS